MADVTVRGWNVICLKCWVEERRPFGSMDEVNRFHRDFIERHVDCASRSLLPKGRVEVLPSGVVCEDRRRFRLT